jgi:hypothetical protein
MQIYNYKDLTIQGRKNYDGPPVIEYLELWETKE